MRRPSVAMAGSLKMIDIAANLTDDMFKGVYHGKQYHAPDLQAVLSRAWNAGVDRIVVTGGSLRESQEALAMAETDGRLFCTVGVHPTRCMVGVCVPCSETTVLERWWQEFEESEDPDKHLDELLQLARIGQAKGKVVAVGECGLDYDRLQFCPADVQRRYFEKQFHLAERTGLPMFLHMRGAADDFCRLMEANQHRLVSGVVHSFTGSAADRDRILKFPSLYIGINGCSLKTKENLEVVAGIPVERLMIETDSPYCEIRPTHAGHKHISTLWPSNKKEKQGASEQSLVKSRNEPCLVRQVLEVVAACHGGSSDLHSLARSIYENTCKVFFPQDLGTVWERGRE